MLRSLVRGPDARRRARSGRAAALAAAGSLLLAPGTAGAQAQPARPTPPPHFAITNARIVPVSGPAIPQGTVVVRDGRIVDAGPNAQAPAGAMVIDATGLHVYPGLFDAASSLGLSEIRSVDVTVDVNELGDFTPHLQARTAVHPASVHLPVARANGITHTMAVPLAGGGRFGGSAAGFSGQGSVFSLDGWSIEEMEIVPSAVMVMEWPSIRTREFDRSTYTFRSRPYKEAKEEYDRSVARVTEWLDAARSYRHTVQAGGRVTPDLRLEALGRVVSGELPVLARVERERDIRAVVQFAEAQGLRLIVAGASDGYRVAELLAEKRIPVILGPAQSLPSEAHRSFAEAYANPGKLHEAGVKIAFATFSASDSRTLPYEAAMGIPYGLPREAALRAVTIAPAEILGLGDRLGTIQPGKLANLIVTDGDPLEITTQVRHLIVDGREVSTMNRHQELYEMYRARPRANP